MNDSEQIALIYESSILLEDASKRIDYLFAKYSQPLIAWREENKSIYDKEDNAVYVRGLVSDIVNNTDPTHGRYSEWLVRKFVDWGTRSILNWPVAMQNIVRGQDTYKIRDALQFFDRHKGSLDITKRDINKWMFDDLKRWAQDSELSQDKSLNQRSKEIKEKETIKLVDGVDGWTVVIPLTKDSARLYGAHTQWCTAARKDEDNAFNQYNEDGPLFIFINGDRKYQWWIDVDNPHEERGHWGDDEDDHEDELTLDAQFMDVHDEPASMTDIPYNVWEAVYRQADKYVAREPFKLHRALPLMRTWVEQEANIDNGMGDM